MKNKKNAAPSAEEAVKILLKYKKEKNSLESRYLAENKVWENIYSGEESSSWIFNSIVNKHADIIDSIPTCVCLPREKRDEKYSSALSKIIPVISERCGFEQIYSDNSWEKLKHGTSVWGVFWNNSLEDGLGDIDIRALPISSLFWDMSVSNIQDSKNLFITAISDVEELETCFGIDYGEVKERDSALATSLGYSVGEGKCLTVDWYYKKYMPDGTKRLHLTKIVGDRVLYCSENDPSCAEGWYNHGCYPVVFDRLYPTEGICGFGLIAISTSVQGYINRIDDNMLGYSDWASRVRFWAKRSLGVNEKEFLDLNRSIVEVEGDIDEEKLRQIEISPIDSSLVDVKRQKIEELKEITGSRDVSQGGVTGGVTAASAISILREAGAKTSRDGIKETYRAYITVVSLMIELMRQFYDGERVFRIVGEDGGVEFIGFAGRELRDEEKNGFRPHFDIEINATKKSPSESEQKNQFAKELYDSGALKRENAVQTLMMLDLMDFDGVGKLKSDIRRAYSVDGGEVPV